MQQVDDDPNGRHSRACEALVNEANERGGEDNLTVVLARLTGDDLPSPDTDRITVELPPPDGDDTIGHEDDPTERLDSRAAAPALPSAAFRLHERRFNVKTESVRRLLADELRPRGGHKRR